MESVRKNLDDTFFVVVVVVVVLGVVAVVVTKYYLNIFIKKLQSQIRRFNLF